MKAKLLFLGFTALGLLSACVRTAPTAKAPVSEIVHAHYTRNAVIYEVNLRQYTPQGTLAAFAEHLPRLADMGVDILWFMPVHPIGVVERKGELGSYYSVRDYKDMNPEFGTLRDFRDMVSKAHALGMKVILDWVAGHTSRDHAWVTDHPDWYVYDTPGHILAPYDWTDVARLDYDNSEMRLAMEREMLWWVEEMDIDGYRCDVADSAPEDFWFTAFDKLRKVKSDLFFLAESEDPKLSLRAFDAYYGWGMHHLINDLVGGKADLDSLRRFVAAHDATFAPNALCMNFTSNHDENAWNGTEFERLGNAVRLGAAFSFALPGIPEIYTAQEVGYDKRMEFFRRDPVSWEDRGGYTDFYRELIAFRDAHPALYAPPAGALLEEIATDAPDRIYAFQRELQGRDTVLCLFNFSEKETTFKLTGKNCFGRKTYTLDPWGYKFVESGKTPFARKTRVTRVEPPCWWVGMKTPLQLMFYGADIQNCEISSLSEGITIAGVHRAQSPNYLFADIRIAPNAQPGEYKIRVGDHTVIYSLLARDPQSDMREGFTAGDLMYLLVPDRFVNGNPSNDNMPDCAEKAQPANVAGRYGGDIEGIMKMLPYLEDLGVGAIWSTPLLWDNEPTFSYHGYACADYYKIDPRFGTNQGYRQYCREAVRHGMKVVMDIVPNHCGTAHWWMQDLPFRDWIHNFTDSLGQPVYVNSNFAMSTCSDPYAAIYDRDLCVNGWFDYSMADMNLQNPFCLKYFQQFAVWWTEYAGLGGLRIDTYPYSDKYAMDLLVQAVMEEYPHYNIVTECWFNSAAELSYWEGGKTNADGFTSHIPTLMDFFLMGNLAAAVNESGRDMASSGGGMMRIYNVLAQDYLYDHPGNMMIFADNHDTRRLFHSLGRNHDKQKMAFALLATLRGFPQLYYGDEWGFYSVDGKTGDVYERIPFDRQMAQMEKHADARQALHDYARKLFTWRKNCKTVQYGTTRHFRPSDNLYVYFRYLPENPKDRVMVVVNNDTETRSIDWPRYAEIAEGFAGREIISGTPAAYGTELRIPAGQVMIFE